jgi:RNA polymerase sigma-54 factor
MLTRAESSNSSVLLTRVCRRRTYCTIRSLIKKLVEAEKSSKPISDSTIAEILSDQGIHVARRTVAKYRETLNIPPSSQRKSLV